MKRFIYLLAIALVSVMTVSCNGCKEKNEIVNADTLAVGELVVENTVSTDRQYMYKNYGDDYRWYETCILLKDFMDEECDGSIEGISNIFQYITNVDSTSFDVNVVLSAYNLNGNHVYEVKEGFWVGDSPMNDDVIKVTYKEAFDKMMAANYPKPHSRHCVLRREVGPVPNVAPQYIFGNQKAQLYVDATTGNVTDKNPAFGNFGMPLGEWP